MKGLRRGEARRAIHAGSAARAAAMVAATGWLLLSGCGSTTTTSVASVQGTTISRVALAHWTRIKRLELQSAPASTSSLSPAQLERKALVFLITGDWLQAEARAEGIDLPSSGVEATYRHLVNGPSGQSFASGLRSRGMSRADELLVLRLQALSNKLRAEVGAGHDRLKAFVAAFRQRWKQRTSCRTGYIVPECRNGPALPSSPN